MGLGFMLTAECSSVNDPLPIERSPLAGRRAKAAIRVAGLLAFLALLAAMVDLPEVWARVSSFSGASLALTVALQAVIVVALSWRFAIAARAAGAGIDVIAANRLTFLSTLANLLLPTSLAGDAGRVLFVRGYGLGLSSALAVGIFDRFVGLAALGAIVLAGAAVAPGTVEGGVIATISLIVAALGVAIFVHWRQSGRLQEAAGALRVLRPGVVGASVALSLLGHLLSVTIAFAILRDLGVAVSFGHTLLLFPAVLLSASLPVSVGGWGARELAAVAVFPLVGVPGPAAMAMTLIFGLSQLLACVLGAAVLGLVRRG
jgi:uncharacterized membrane protein YbhN (UPF0104 family)